MKYTLTLLLSLTSLSAFSQEDSVKFKLKKWEITLTDRQKTALVEFDQASQSLQQQIQNNEAMKVQYLRSIIESKDIDLATIQDFKLEDGIITFVEKRPK